MAIIRRPQSAPFYAALAGYGNQCFAAAMAQSNDRRRVT